MIDDEVFRERERLEKDVALVHRLKTVADIDDLLLRITDAVENIRFHLDCESTRDGADDPHPDRLDWRKRATTALEKHKMVLAQVKRRRDMVARREERR